MGERQKHTSQFLLSLALAVVFLMIALFTAVLGANIYRSTAAASDSNSEIRTNLLYLTQRVRRAGGDISLAKFGDGDAFIVKTREDGRDYHTYVYTSGGALRELTADATVTPDPSLGQEIFEAEGMSLTVEGRLLTAVINFEGGRSAEAKISLRGNINEG